MLSKGKKIYVTPRKGGSLRVAALEYLKGLKGEGNRIEGYWISESPGEWFNPTGLFGLCGAVKDDEFTNIFAGRHPHTGAALGAKVDLDRMCGMEFVCSPPKDFSILWSAGNPEQRCMLEAMHDRAVDRVIQFLQERAARSRKGKGGRGGLVKASLIAALFRHATSREADPLIHTHIAVVNLAILPNGKLRALEFRRFLEWRGAASAVYRVALAADLATLGIRVARSGRNFILPDVPRGLVAEQSRRRRLMEAFHADLVKFLRARAEGGEAPVAGKCEQAIHRFINEWRAQGKPMLRWPELTLNDGGGGYADAVALATRSNKPKLSQDVIEAEWAAKRAKYGFAIDQVLGKPLQLSAAEVRIVRASIAKLSARAAVLEERDVIRMVAEHGQGTIGYRDVEVALCQARAGKELIAVRDATDEISYTTIGAIERASRIVESVQRRLSEGHHEIAAVHYQAVVDGPATLTGKQRAALACSALGRGVSVIKKTKKGEQILTMKAVCEMHQRAGYEVVGCAFSRKGFAVLPGLIAIATTTIDRFLSDVGALIRRIGKKTCILVDTAQVNSAHGEALLEVAERSRSKILLVGSEHHLLPSTVAAEMARTRGHSSTDIMNVIVSEPIDNSAGHHLFDRLGSEQVREILANRQAKRDPDAGEMVSRETFGLQVKVPLAELVPPLLPLKLDPRVLMKRRQLCSSRALRLTPDSADPEVAEAYESQLEQPAG